ncbi:MAG: methyltransferase [Neisseria sp.]|nr:methyltransferase [Neisseria sp.]
MNDFSLHTLFAQAMDARLDCVKATPKNILLIGGDGGASRALLAKRYPTARMDAVVADDDCAAAETAAIKRQRTWRQLLPQHRPQLFRQPVSAPLPSAAYDCLWANLCTAVTDKTVLSAWRAALRPDGMVFFSTFGVDTLREIRALLQTAEMDETLPDLPDMHDIGDELLRCGFSDPVTDMEKRTLTYRTPQRFWDDVAMLGLTDYVPHSAAGRELVEQALLKGSLHGVTLEIVYGHAVHLFRQPEEAGEATVQFYRQRPSFDQQRLPE